MGQIKMVDERLHQEDFDNKSASCDASSGFSKLRSEDPQTIALQGLCKQLLKSRLFRGFYEVRYYVTDIQSYRDIVSLHCSEKDLQKLLKDVRIRLQQYYGLKESKLWIGLTMGIINGVARQLQGSDTFIWTELNDLAFGEYWFSIRSIRFRDNEVLLKLKVVRPVELESQIETVKKEKAQCFTINENKDKFPEMNKENTNAENLSSKNSLSYLIKNNASFSASQSMTPTFNDIIDVLFGLFDSLKLTIYNFLAHDINKDNIIASIRFMFLLMFGLLTGGFTVLKHLGVFIIYLLAEITRLTNALTPIILTLLQMVSRTIGALLYIVTMIWKDTIGGLHQGSVNQERKKQIPSISYNRYSSNCENGNIPYSNINQNIPQHRFRNQKNPFIIHE